MRPWTRVACGLSLLLLLCPILPFAGLRSTAQATDELEQILDFELPAEGELPGGWSGGTANTLFVDHAQFWSGHAAGRIERAVDSEGQFSTFTHHIPVDFDGNSIRYSGYLRSQGVEEWAGLWMRVDGAAGALAFDNMQKRAVTGTSKWTRYEINLGLPDGAKEIYFGALLAGPGKLWVDALSIEIDGVPLAGVERVAAEPTSLDLEREFDEGSRIVITEVDAWQIESLVLLGRIWGFLKYHHPTVVQGQRHWDYALFRVMARMLEAQQEATCQVILEDWILSLGEVESCAECATYEEDAHLHVEMEWIHDEQLLGAELAVMLGNIRRQRPALEEQFFVGRAPNIGNPVFQHEPSYEHFEAPDPGYRLLALFRYWNIIEYWFPYRDLIEEDWVEVLQEFIPRVLAATDGDDYRREMMQLIARVHDTHANLWSELRLRPPV